jgi:hypothetical protein
MSKKLNKADYVFKNLNDQILEKKPGQINGIDFKLGKLKNCTVYLCDYIAAVISFQIDLCRRVRELPNLHGASQRVDLCETMQR